MTLKALHMPAIATWFEPLRQSLDRLPARDRRALLILSIFLLLSVLLGALWLTHHQKQQAQTAANDARELLVWMRAQAPRLQQGQANTQPLSTRIQDAAAQQGLVITQTGTDQQVQVSLTQPQFAVIGSWLSRLAAEGIQIKQMDIQQQGDGQLQLQATLVQQ
ncbi:MAG: hypothetical protein RLY58_1916 [Pseudomonadota bacterium]|jgi:general secretion pathway protein M